MLLFIFHFNSLSDDHILDSPISKACADNKSNMFNPFPNTPDDFKTVLNSKKLQTITEVLL